MTTSRFAYISPAQAGERRTVRHVIGALRQPGSNASIVGASSSMVRRENHTF